MTRKRIGVIVIIDGISCTAVYTYSFNIDINMIYIYDEMETYVILCEPTSCPI